MFTTLPDNKKFSLLELRVLSAVIMFVCGYSVHVGSGNSPVVVIRLPGGQS